MSGTQPSRLRPAAWVRVGVSIGETHPTTAATGCPHARRAIAHPQQRPPRPRPRPGAVRASERLPPAAAPRPPAAGHRRRRRRRPDRPATSSRAANRPARLAGHAARKRLKKIQQRRGLGRIPALVRAYCGLGRLHLGGAKSRTADICVGVDDLRGGPCTGCEVHNCPCLDFTFRPQVRNPSSRGRAPRGRARVRNIIGGSCQGTRT
jgi:hypothetical protein